jgi:hypothetical protein
MYTPLDFCSNFALCVTDDDPRTVREVVDSKDEKLSKKAMVEEMTTLYKNEAWDLVEFLTRRNQRKYVEKILHRFNMQDCKPIKVPIPLGVSLCVDQCPKTHEEEEDMSHVAYASAIGILMNAILYTRPYVAHVVGVLIRYMSKPWKKH